MRKYIIGMFIGVALTISTSVFAEDVITLIGQKIQGEFPVKINGEQLEKPAIVINGTSYLPNRAIADALGMDIKFDADLGIELTNKEVTMVAQETTLSAMTEPAVTEIVYTADTIEAKIITYQVTVDNLNYTIEHNPSRENVGKWEEQLKYAQDQLTIWETRKAALVPTPTP
jgi:hypothetical protein